MPTGWRALKSCWVYLIRLRLPSPRQKALCFLRFLITRSLQRAGGTRALADARAAIPTVNQRLIQFFPHDCG